MRLFIIALLLSGCATEQPVQERPPDEVSEKYAEPKKKPVRKATKSVSTTTTPSCQIDETDDKRVAVLQALDCVKESKAP